MRDWLSFCVHVVGCECTCHHLPISFHFIENDAERHLRRLLIFFFSAHSQLTLMMPYSRVQELEADAFGLEYASRVSSGVCVLFIEEGVECLSFPFIVKNTEINGF